MGNAVSGGLSPSLPPGNLLNLLSQAQTSPLTEEQRMHMEDYPFLHAVGCISTSRISSSLLCVSVSDGLTFCKLFVNKNVTGAKGPPLDLRLFQAQKLLHKAGLTFDLHPNICPDERLLLGDRSALLLRRYFSGTVWERLHAQPAPTPSQLLFLCFQLLAGVAQLHSLGFVHCDVKTENLGVTSVLHLFLTDAAPWKDVDLRLRDMRAFSLLFESSKRSRCYLAPERFADKEEPRKVTGEGLAERHSAEMFSVNCTLAEIVLEGADVIDLLHLLELRDWLTATQQQQQQQQSFLASTSLEATDEVAASGIATNTPARMPRTLTGAGAAAAGAATAATGAAAASVQEGSGFLFPGLAGAPASPPPPAALLHLLEGISCRRMRALLLHGGLLQRPHLRLSAQQTLLLWLQHVFPPSFANYFLCLFTVLLHPAYQQPDMRILLLKEHLPDLVLALLEQRSQTQQQQQQQQQVYQQQQQQRRESEAQDHLLLQLLREAVARETLEVDACIMHQTVLNMAVTMPQESPAAAALLHSWSAGGFAGADAAAAAAAAATPLAVQRVLCAAAGPAGGETTEERLLAAEAAQESAAAAALSGSLPHPVLTARNARRFGWGLMSLWARCHEATVLAKRPAVEVLEEIEGEKLQLYDDLFKQPSNDTDPAAAAAAAAAGTGSTGLVTHASSSFPVYPSLVRVSLLLCPPQLPSHLFETPAAAAAAATAACASTLPVGSPSPLSAAEETADGRWGCAGCLRSGCCILATEVIGFALQHTTSPRIRACGVSLLQFLSRFATTEVLLESLLPFLIHYLGDPLPLVRVAAVKALAAALMQLNAALQHEAACPRLRTEGPLCAFCGSACGSQVPYHDVFAAAAAASSSSSSWATRSERGTPLLQQHQEGPGGWRSSAGEGAPQADAAALFCGYILPVLHRLSTADTDAAVRVAVAENLPLMLLAVRACLHSQSLLGLRKQQQQQQQACVSPKQTATATARSTAAPAADSTTDGDSKSYSVAAAASREAVSPHLMEGDGVVLLQGPTEGSEGSPFGASVAARGDSFSSSYGLRSSAFAAAGDEAQAAAPLAVEGRRPEGAEELTSAAASPSPVFVVSSAAATDRSEVPGLAEQQLGNAISKLHAAVLPTLQQLLTCRPAEQRLALLRPLPLLAAVLGSHQTHSFLLPYLIVQLNDPCAALRAAVIRSVGGLGALALPSTAESCIIPCCEQCLLDQQEEVVVAAAAALAQLATDGLLSPASKATYTLLRRRVVPLLLFPSLVLRGVLLHLLAAIQKSWGSVQTYALLLPLLRPVLRRGAALLRTEQVAAALRPPLSRQVFLYVMQQQQHGSSSSSSKTSSRSSSDVLLSLLFSPSALSASGGAYRRRGAAKQKGSQKQRQRQQRVGTSSSSGSCRPSSGSDNDSSTDSSSNTSTSDEGGQTESSEKDAESAETCTSSLGHWQAVVLEAERRAAAAAAAPPRGSPSQQLKDGYTLQEQQQQQHQQQVRQVVAAMPSGSSMHSPVQELVRYLHRIGAADRHALLLLLPTLHARRQAVAANAAAANAAGDSSSCAVEYPLGSSVDTLGLLEGTADGVMVPLVRPVFGVQPRECPCCRVDFSSTKQLLSYMLPRGPPCRQMVSAMRLSPVPPNTPPIARISLWGLLAETLLPHVTRLVVQQQQLLLQRCLSSEETSDAAASSFSSISNFESYEGYQQQQSLLHAAGGVFPSDFSYLAAKAAVSAGAAAATAVAGALDRYLCTYKPQPSLLQALLGLATHCKSSSPLTIQASYGSAVISSGYFCLLLTVAAPAAAVAALNTDAQASPVARSALHQLLLHSAPAPKGAPNCPYFLEAAAATAGATAAAAAEWAACGKRLQQSFSALSPYRNGTSPGVPPPLQRDWRCILLCLPRRPSLEVGRLQRQDEGPFSLYPYQQRLSDSLDALATTEGRHSTLSRRLSTGTLALVASATPPLSRSSSSSSTMAASAVTSTLGHPDRNASAVVGGVADGLVQLAGGVGSTSGVLAARPSSSLARQDGALLAASRSIEGKSAPHSGGGVAGLPDLSCWRPRGQWLRSLSAFEASCSRGGGSLSLAATDDGRLLCVAPLGLKGGEIHTWKASTILNHSRPPVVGSWQLPSHLHLTTHCLLQNTKTLALGTSDGACHLLRLDSSSTAVSNPAGASIIPGALLRLQTPRLLPAPISSKPSVLLELLQQQQHGQCALTTISGGLACSALYLARLALKAAATVGTSQRITAGMAAARAATATAAAGGCGVACLSHQDTALEQLLLYALRNGLFGGWELRTASPLFVAHVPPWLGVPSAQAVGTDGRWLVLGTTGGLLLQFDLRMQLPLRAWVLQPPVPIKQLLLVDSSAAAVALNSASSTSNISSTWELQQHQFDPPTCCMLALVERECFPLLLLDLQAGCVVTAYNTSCLADAATAALASATAASTARDRLLPQLVPLPIDALQQPSSCNNLLQSPREMAALRGAERGALHMPCCFWAPSPLRGAAGYVLVAGEDRCVHYWDLAEEQAGFAAKLAAKHQQQQQQQRAENSGFTGPIGEAKGPASNVLLLDNDLVGSYCVLGPQSACGCRDRENSAPLTASLTVDGVRILQRVCCQSVQGRRFLLHAAAADQVNGRGEAGPADTWETLRTAAYSAAERGEDLSSKGTVETGYTGQGRCLMMLKSASSKSNSSSNSTLGALGPFGRGCCCTPLPSAPWLASWAPTWPAEDETDALPGFASPSPMHRDAIIDLAAVGQEDLFLVTAGRDGVVKIWS